MKQLIFESYVEGETQPKSFKHWLYLWQAMNNPGWNFGGDRPKLKRMLKLLDAFDLIMVTTKVDETATRYKLKPEGGTLLLEDAEFDLLKEGWEQYSRGLPAGATRDIISLDEFLAEAKAPPKEVVEA